MDREKRHKHCNIVPHQWQLVSNTVLCRRYTCIEKNKNYMKHTFKLS